MIEADRLITPDASTEDEVIDRAEPILPSLKSRVFQKYAMSVDSNKTAHSSHGVGLSITKRLVEECDGEIDTYNRKDLSGNIFFIELPLDSVS